MGDLTEREKAWSSFDEIIRRAEQSNAERGEAAGPWEWDGEQPVFRTDDSTLCALLDVPVRLGAASRTGIPALALDVWLSYEFRRAGFDADSVWPRPLAPRILVPSAKHIIEGLSPSLRAQVWSELGGKTVKGASAASANILGKNYFKQVDVIMSDWDTGPELLVSTKRMDSSYGKNIANRIEESYGDAKNLRLRHPRAALGFLFAVNANILVESPASAEWLMDLLEKLGQEEDAYNSTSLLIMSVNYDNLTESDSSKPIVSLDDRYVPDSLHRNKFVSTLVKRVLEETPVRRHREARMRMASVLPPDSARKSMITLVEKS